MQVQYWKRICIYWVLTEELLNSIFISKWQIVLTRLQLWLIWRRTRCLIENENLQNTNVTIYNILQIKHWSHIFWKCLFFKFFWWLVHFDMCTIRGPSSSFQNIRCWGLCNFLRQGNISYSMSIIWMCAGAPMMQITNVLNTKIN